MRIFLHPEHIGPVTVVGPNVSVQQIKESMAGSARLKITNPGDGTADVLVRYFETDGLLGQPTGRGCKVQLTVGLSELLLLPPIRYCGIEISQLINGELVQTIHVEKPATCHDPAFDFNAWRLTHLSQPGEIVPEVIRTQEQNTAKEAELNRYMASKASP